MVNLARFLVFLIVLSLISTGCSTENTSSGGSQTETVNPPPQVRVEAMPTATATLPGPTEEPTLEPTATPGQAFIWSPPSEDEIISQIEMEIDQIDQKLNSQNFIFNP